jgi:hypothetical protein
MARKSDVASGISAEQTLIDGTAKYFIEKLYGPDGMPWGTRFADLEELSFQLGQAISRSMMDQALTRQSQTVPPEAEICSGCGGHVAPTADTEPRAVLTRMGTAHWPEPKRYCPRCRAAFFPSDPGVGD